MFIFKDNGEETKVKAGLRFKYLNDTEYILARPSVGTFVLISLTDGNRWTEPVHCEGSFPTESEFLQICGYIPARFRPV